MRCPGRNAGLGPAAVLAAETEIHAMLYSGLDAEQRAVYDLLLAEGVLNA
jgi:hypothetical protein